MATNAHVRTMPQKLNLPPQDNQKLAANPMQGMTPCFTTTSDNTFVHVHAGRHLCALPHSSASQPLDKGLRTANYMVRPYTPTPLAVHAHT